MKICTFEQNGFTYDMNEDEMTKEKFLTTYDFQKKMKIEIRFTNENTGKAEEFRKMVLLSIGLI